jgi:hypothetical protein
MSHRFGLILLDDVAEGIGIPSLALLYGGLIVH